MNTVLLQKPKAHFVKAANKLQPAACLLTAAPQVLRRSRILRCSVCTTKAVFETTLAAPN
jgi:hypothetical protein